jgi:hypothetical protein
VVQTALAQGRVLEMGDPLQNQCPQH